jgi:DNA-binding NarL/FixJ family response regulator
MRLLIADDHPFIRIGLAKVLREETGAEIDEAGSIPDLRGALEKQLPDVLILDLNLHTGNSLDVIPELRRLYPRLGILVLSVHPEEQAGIRAMLAGANGYLNKTSAPEQLVTAVLRVAEGKRYVSEELGSALAEYLIRGQAGRRPHETLSDREYTVLLKISEGMTTVEIAESLHLSPKTVGTYRARILEKMGIHTTAELTRYVVENGLVNEPQKGEE